jgi:holo-[acyl-carrier protein] synthase
MIMGIGIDVVEVDRIAAMLRTNRYIGKRILPAAWFEEGLSAESLAGRFALLEAAIKAVSSEMRTHLASSEFSKSDGGKPRVTFRYQGSLIVLHASISHTNQIAVASVIWEE